LWVEASVWTDTGITVAANAPAALVSWFASLGSKQVAQKAALWVGLAAIILGALENRKENRALNCCSTPPRYYLLIFCAPSISQTSFLVSASS
jgi:hypothetical protein